VPECVFSPVFNSLNKLRDLSGIPPDIINLSPHPKKEQFPSITSFDTNNN
jgi:hypothetical protein